MKCERFTVSINGNINIRCIQKKKVGFKFLKILDLLCLSVGRECGDHIPCLQTGLLCRRLAYHFRNTGGRRQCKGAVMKHDAGQNEVAQQKVHRYARQQNDQALPGRLVGKISSFRHFDVFIAFFRIGFPCHGNIAADRNQTQTVLCLLWLEFQQQRSHAEAVFITIDPEYLRGDQVSGFMKTDDHRKQDQKIYDRHQLSFLIFLRAYSSPHAFAASRSSTLFRGVNGAS